MTIAEYCNIFGLGFIANTLGCLFSFFLIQQYEKYRTKEFRDNIRMIVEEFEKPKRRDETQMPKA